MSEPEITVSFNSKHPHETLWIELCYPEATPPAELIADLSAIGFIEDGLGQAPPLDGVACVHLGKRGCALFAGWTDDERRENLKQARAVLRHHGFVGVPHNKLTWHDLI